MELANSLKICTNEGHLVRIGCSNNVSGRMKTRLRWIYNEVFTVPTMVVYFIHVCSRIWRNSTILLSRIKYLCSISHQSFFERSIPQRFQLKATLFHQLHCDVLSNRSWFVDIQVNPFNSNSYVKNNLMGLDLNNPVANWWHISETHQDQKIWFEVTQVFVTLSDNVYTGLQMGARA